MKSRDHNGIAFLLLRPLYQAPRAKSSPPVFKGRLPYFLPDLSSTVKLGVSEIRGTVFWSPFNKDPTIWGTIFDLHLRAP